MPPAPPRPCDGKQWSGLIHNTLTTMIEFNFLLLLYVLFDNNLYNTTHTSFGLVLHGLRTGIDKLIKAYGYTIKPLCQSIHSYPLV